MGMAKSAAASKHVPRKSGKRAAAKRPDGEAAKHPVSKGKVTNPDVARAVAELIATDCVLGVRSARISARVDPGVLGAAAAALGLARHDVSAIVNASLALAAAPDRFKRWLADPGPRLPDNFERPV